MRRAATWVVCAAVVGLAAAAVVDGARPDPRPPAPAPSGPAEALAASGVEGALVLAGADCRTRTVALPSLAVRSRPGGCGGVARGVGSPLGRETVARALAGRLDDPGSYRVAELAVVDDDRNAAILRGGRPWQQAVAVFAGSRVELLSPQLGSRLSGLRVSSGGRIAFLRSDVGRTAVLLAPSGREVVLPPIANVRAVALSPDDRWTALATRTATFIARTGTDEVVARVPHGAEFVAWN